MNITGSILASAKTQPHDKVALIDDHGVTTYGQLSREIARRRVALIHLGVRAGHRVIFCMADSREWLLLYFAVHHIGAISVLMNPALPAALANAMIASCDPDHVLCSDLDTTPALAEHEIGDVICDMRLIDLPVNVGDLPTAYEYTQEHTAHWCTSSGTSGGVPKWVVHGAEAIETSPWAIAKHHRMTSESVVHCTPRLSFHYGLMHNIAPMTKGGVAVLTEHMPASRLLLNTLQKHQITHLYSTPHVLANLDKHTNKVVLPKLQYVYSGGEVLPAAVEDRFLQLFGIPILNCIGMAEIYSWCTVQWPDLYRPGSIGLVFDPMLIEIRDPDTGEICDTNIPGELWVQSSTRARGYHNNHDATEKTFPGTWYRSSDIVYADPDGFLFYVCRNDNNVRIKAGYVNLDSVESKIVELDAVEDCVVSISVNNRGFAELNAEVRLAPGHVIDPAQIKNHLRQSLPADKIPRNFVVVDDLRRTVTTKKMRG